MPADLQTDELSQILYSGKLNAGVYVKKFEDVLKEYIGCPYVLVTSNNNYASLIALAALGVGEGDEVISSSMACLATNMPVLNFKAKLVWADIDPLTGSLDPEAVKRKITPKTKAIIHYHWGGYPGYVDEINKIGSEHGIPVIDDAIESFGSEYKGKKVGNLNTDITTFSFQTVRLPHSIDGGAIAFKSESLFLKALKMRDFGIDRSTFRDPYGEISATSDIKQFGYNAIMNELNAYIGLNVLKHVPALIQQQRENAIRWDLYCQQNHHIPLNTRDEIYPNYWIYSFLCECRDEEFFALRKEGYFASKMHLRNDYYSCFGEMDRSLKGVSEFEARQLSVPSGWWIGFDDYGKGRK